MAHLIGFAEFSEDKLHRWRLTRENLQGLLAGVTGSLKTVTFIMLNPSTATATEDDPTIRRCTTFAQTWGYDRLVIVNVYGYRATQPADMWRAQASGIDIVGDKNDEAILRAIVDARSSGGDVIAAWGKHARPDRVAKIRAMVGPHTLRCFAINGDGSPTHPLYQPNSAIPIMWTGKAVQ